MSQTLIGALRVVLGLDSAAFEKGATAAERKANAFAKRMEKLGTRMTAFGQGLSTSVTLPLVGFGTKAVMAAMDAQKAVASVDQALASMGQGAGFTSKRLQEIAAELERTTTFDGDDILSKVTANLLTFGKVQGQVFERAQVAALDLSARLGTDLQSATIMLGKALNDPVRGMTALTRAGVSFSEEQKNTIKTLAETGRVAEAQRLILAELEKQFGGQAQAMANTQAGRLQQAYVQLGNAMEEVGAALLPVLANLAQYVTQITAAFQELSPGMQQFIVVGGLIAAAMGPVALAVGNLVAAFGALIRIAPAVRAAMLLASGPIGMIVTAVAAAAVAIYTNWDRIVSTFNTARDAVTAAARLLYEGVKTWLQDKLTAVFDWVNQKIETVRATFANLYDAVVGNSYIPDMVDEIGQHMSRLDGELVKPAQQASDRAKQAFEGIAMSLVGVVQGTRSARDAILDVVNDIAGAMIRSGISSLTNAVFGGAGMAFAGGYASGGVIPAGRFGLVGERGPELIASGRSPLTVYPNEAFGGGGTVYNIDARGSTMTPDQFRAILEQRDRALRAEVPSLVQRGRVRGRV